MKTRRNSQFVGLFLGVSLFFVALLFLRDELRNVSWGLVLDGMRHIGRSRIVLATIFTFLSYLLLTFYDFFALVYVKKTLSYLKVALASFCGFTLSYNLGFSLLTGGTLRYRVYTAWGIQPSDVAKIIAFSGAIFWLGVFFLAGPILVFRPSIGIMSYEVPQSSLVILGLGLIGTVCVFLWYCYRGERIKLGSYSLPAPLVSVAIGGILVSALDWCSAALVLFVLIPLPTSEFFHFLAVFQVAQIIGLISHVPGGVGVFEALMLRNFSTQIQTATLISGLLLFRVIYYLIPFAVSLVLLIGHEAFLQRIRLIKVYRRVSDVAGFLIPIVITGIVFVSGIILLFSGATPPVEHRFAILERYIPLPLIEIAHFIASVLGISLLVLARALLRRLDAAYYLTIFLLSSGIIVSLLKGIDFEEAVVLFFILSMLIPCRRYFYRHGALSFGEINPQIVFLLALVLLSTTWLLFFAYEDVTYSSTLWWEFRAEAHVSRSLRATLGAFSILGLWSLVRLVSLSKPDVEYPEGDELWELLPIVQRSRGTYSYLALTGDKFIYFNETRTAFVMYGIENNNWIAYGDPIGEKCEKIKLIESFSEYCDRHGGIPVFYYVSHKTLSMYLDMGLSLIKVGEEAIVDLLSFSLDGRKMRALRSNRAKMERLGTHFEILSPEDAEPFFQRFKEISDDWLSLKKTYEKGFSLGFFSPEYLSFFPMAVVWHNGSIVAWANILMGAEKYECSVDLMRYSTEAPSGVMDFLFTELMLWAQGHGFKRFNLGMAPLSGLLRGKSASIWHKVATLIFEQGERFYNFQGVRFYKEKFEPIWESRFLASPGGLKLPSIATSLVSLSSGSLSRAFLK